MFLFALTSCAYLESARVAVETAQATLERNEDLANKAFEEVQNAEEALAVALKTYEETKSSEDVTAIKAATKAVQEAKQTLEGADNNFKATKEAIKTAQADIANAESAEEVAGVGLGWLVAALLGSSGLGAAVGLRKGKKKEEQ